MEKLQSTTCYVMRTRGMVDLRTPPPPPEKQKSPPPNRPLPFFSLVYPQPFPNLVIVRSAAPSGGEMYLLFWNYGIDHDNSVSGYRLCKHMVPALIQL